MGQILCAGFCCGDSSGDTTSSGRGAGGQGSVNQGACPSSTVPATGNQLPLQGGIGLLPDVFVFLQRHNPELASDSSGLCDSGKSLEILTLRGMLHLCSCFRTRSSSRNDELDLKLEIDWLSEPPCVGCAVWAPCSEGWPCPLSPLFISGGNNNFSIRPPCPATRSFPVIFLIFYDIFKQMVEENKTSPCEETHVQPQ